MINKKGEMYNIIHTIDPDILTLGSNMFKFIKKKKNKFVLDIRNNDKELKRYLSYSEENMCKTFEWLKQHRFKSRCLLHSHRLLYKYTKDWK